jgi:hypothetical protein
MLIFQQSENEWIVWPMPNVALHKLIVMCKHCNSANCVNTHVLTTNLN